MPESLHQVKSGPTTVSTGSSYIRMRINERKNRGKRSPRRTGLAPTRAQARTADLTPASATLFGTALTRHEGNSDYRIHTKEARPDTPPQNGDDQDMTPPNVGRLANYIERIWADSE